MNADAIQKLEQATGAGMVGVIAVNPETVELGANEFDFDSKMHIFELALSVNDIINLGGLCVGVIIAMDLIRKWKK